MPTREELVEAKQGLSAKLLRAGLRGGVVGMSMAVRAERAIVTAAHNVHAVGIGRKESNGRVTKDLAVRVYVVQKLAESLLPPIYRIPESIDGIPTDVIESAPAFILAAKRGRRSRGRAGTLTMATSPTTPACSTNRRERQRPVVAGISAGHFNITAGTIGYFCRSMRHGDDPAGIFALSNNHVFADVNQANAGDDLYQQAPADGGTPDAHFADLTRWVPIHLGGTVPNRVDGAIGRLRAGIVHHTEICSIGRITDTAAATDGMRVRKHGRTSGYTEGEVTDTSVDALVGMDHDDPNVVALFENQIRIERVDPYPHFGLGGDSGSLVVRQDATSAVGLFFAGPPGGAYGLANHVQDVLNELEIQLV